MPDSENRRKTAEQGFERVLGKVPVKQPINSRNSQNRCFSGVLAVLRVVFRLFYHDPLGTFFGCFPAVFQCWPFGTPVHGRKDCKPNINNSRGGP